MINACVNTIVRNAADTIEICIDSVLPYVKRAIVTVDGRSTDATFEILMYLRMKYPHMMISVSPVFEPIDDLIKLRNEQLSYVQEPWIWIVDSDEVYPKEVMENVGKYIKNDDVYAFQSWAVWNYTHAHKSTSKTIIPRIFKNLGGMRWRGQFGGEILSYREPKLLPFRYVHFTHVKNDNWRDELHQQRTVDGKTLTPLPKDIIPIVEKYYATKQKMQVMQ